MPKNLALPKQYRGQGDLRSIVDRNTRIMLTHINQQLVAYEDDGALNLFYAPSVTLPSAVFEGTKMGFFGETPVVRPTVVGSRASGAAYTSLLDAMAVLGLVIDNSTA